MEQRISFFFDEKNEVSLSDFYKYIDGFGKKGNNGLRIFWSYFDYNTTIRVCSWSNTPDSINVSIEFTNVINNELHRKVKSFEKNQLLIFIIMYLRKQKINNIRKLIYTLKII